MVVLVEGMNHSSRKKRMTSTVKMRFCVMVSRVPLKRASGGKVAGSTLQRCSRVTVRVWFFLGLPRGVMISYSAGAVRQAGAACCPVCLRAPKSHPPPVL